MQRPDPFAIVSRAVGGVNPHLHSSPNGDVSASAAAAHQCGVRGVSVWDILAIIGGITVAAVVVFAFLVIVCAVLVNYCDNARIEHARQVQSKRVSERDGAVQSHGKLN